MEPPTSPQEGLEATKHDEILLKGGGATQVT